MAVYRQLVAPRKGTQDGAGWCLRFAQSFFGAPVKYGSAWEAWQGATHKHGPEEPLPTGAAVLLWFSHYGTYSGVYKNWGHVAPYVPGDGIYTSPWYAAWGSEKYKTIAEIERIFNAKYVGWSEAINGLRVAEPAALEPTQRQVFSGGVENAAIRREKPTRQSKDLGSPLAPGTVGNFNGWIRGESVSGNNIWFRGTSGNWFWSGCFTNSKTTGLKDLNPVTPPAVGANQRQVYPGGPENNLRLRKLTTTGSAVVGELVAGKIVTPEGWLKGQSVSGNDIWYRFKEGYAWSGGFTKAGTSGLKDLNEVVIVPEPKPEPEYIDFKAFSPVVTQVLPAHTNNYERGRFPLEQTEVVLHDFGEAGVHTFESVKNTFRNKNSDVSSHFVVSGKEIVQMVPLVDRAYHAGPEGNNRVGIEIDPIVGSLDDTNPKKIETIASVNKLLDALGQQYKTELIRRKHPDFMNTSCGDDIDLDDFAIQVPNGPSPEPGDETAPTWFVNFINALGDFLSSLFKKS